MVKNDGEMDLDTEWVIFGVKNDYTIDWEMADKKREIAYAILGFGAVTSYLFIVACLVKCLDFPTFHYNLR